MAIFQALKKRARCSSPASEGFGGRISTCIRSASTSTPIANHLGHEHITNHRRNSTLDRLLSLGASLVGFLSKEVGEYHEQHCDADVVLNHVRENRRHTLQTAIGRLTTQKARQHSANGRSQEP